MKVRISKKEYLEYVEKDADIALAAEMAVGVVKSDPMVIGEPIAEVSPGCPMGFAKPKVILSYDIINPSVFDKIKIILTRKSLKDIVKEIKGEV
jgi:hypothetical protein